MERETSFEEEEKNGNNIVVYKQQQQQQQLPIGFRFEPTDEELLVHYLKRKVFSQPLPASVIPDLHHLFHLNPWDLPGCLRDKRYFFCKKKMNFFFMSKCSSNLISSTGCGHWKSDQYNWVLQEFCLVGRSSPYQQQQQQQLMNHQKKLMVRQIGDWVACRVYQRKTKSRKSINNKTHEEDDDLGPQIVGSSSPSCSSGVTD
ncbi:NAC domain containing protein 83 [Striga hermonthica]|uniref:NAC domain containing protein 83 n=1 Tax=Striga hermonthica TaxID=68872 RepID=A0A9N7R611_STRHE|nr:NAC domain containing protein 83 [Striga hermonthica]